MIYYNAMPLSEMAISSQKLILSFIFLSQSEVKSSSRVRRAVNSLIELIRRQRAMEEMGAGSAETMALLSAIANDTCAYVSIFSYIT